MPAPIITWYQSGLEAMASNTVAESLTALKNAVDNRVAGFPSTAMWQVASSDLVSAGKYVVLKPTSVATGAGANADMRIMFFGGAGPNSAAINPYTANTSYLYFGIAPNAGVDTPDNSFTAGVPFTTGSWQPSLITASFSSLDRVGYFEHVGGIFVVVRAQDLSGANRIASGIVGECAVSLDNEDIYYMISGSYTSWSISNETNISAATGKWVQAFPSTTGTYPGTFYSMDGITWTRASAIWGPRYSDSQNAWRDGGSNRFFLPVYCRDIGGGSTMMKFRQIAFGPAALYGETLNDMNNDTAFKVGARSDVAEQGPWLTSFEVTC